jgi:hypothetical protein
MNCERIPNKITASAVVLNDCKDTANGAARLQPRRPEEVSEDGPKKEMRGHHVPGPCDTVAAEEADRAPVLVGRHAWIVG